MGEVSSAGGCRFSGWFLPNRLSVQSLIITIIINTISAFTRRKKTIVLVSDPGWSKVIRNVLKEEEQCPAIEMGTWTLS